MHEGTTTTRLGYETIRLLERLRRGAVCRLVAFGFFAVLGGGCFSLLTVVALDWVFDLPPGVRVLGACLFVLGFGLAVLYWIVRPLQRNVSIEHVARRLERRFPELNDRLTSVVCFVGGGADDAMTRRVVLETEGVVAGLAVGRVFTIKPLLLQGLILLAGLSVVGAVSQVLPWWLQTGVLRYVAPFAPYEWPRVVQIEPMSRVVRVASGDTVILRMRVTAGAEVDLRGLVHMRDASGKETVLGMHRGGDSEYRCAVDRVTENVLFWFSAGDDSTEDEPGTIVVSDRPVVVRATARVSPPDYVRVSRVVDFDLGNSPARAVVGSSVGLTFEVSRRIRRGVDGEADAWVETGAGERFGLVFVGDRRDVLQVNLTVRETGTYTVHMVDVEGFENRSVSSYRVLVAEDQTPLIELTRPVRSLEVTATARIPFEVLVEDDFAVTEVVLAARVNGGAKGDGGEVVTSESWMPLAERLGESVGDSLRILADYSLVDLKLSDGDRVFLEVRATDNFVSEDVLGQVGVSRPVHLRIVSRGDFESRLQESLVSVRRRLRSVMETQQKIRAGLKESGGDERGRGWALDQQLRLNRRAEVLVEQVERVGEKALMAIGEGAVGEGVESVRVVGELPEPLRGLVEERMPRVVVLLGDGDADGDEAAIEVQGETIEELRRVLMRMERWTDIQSVMANVRELLDRQQEARRALERLATQTTGKLVDGLDERSRREIGSLSRLQGDLANDVDGMLSRLREQVVEKTEWDGVGEAVRLAVAGELYQRMANAAGAIGENRLMAGRMDQRSAESTLLEMIASIRRRETRRLAKLSRKLEEDEDVVADLLASEKELMAATGEAFEMGAGEGVLERLMAEQRRLGRNAEHVAGGMGEVVETVEAGAVLRDASDEMMSAAGNLVADGMVAGDSVLCRASQSRAVAFLEEALELIRRARRVTEHEAFQRMIASIGEQLGGLVDRQVAVNARTGAVRVAIEEAGQIVRRTAREVRKIEKEQGAIRAVTGEVRDSLKRSVVFARVLDDVMVEMDRCVALIKDRRIDDGLIDTQGEIVRRLDQLVRALADIEKLPPSDEFVSGGGGGGSKGKGASNGPRVPPTAELMMIRTMQEDLLRTTEKLDAEGGTGEMATERQLRAVESLSKQQRGLMELTEMVTKQSRGGS